MVGVRPRLLDLFCGAGGASVGYQRAGFDVVGVDIEPHPDYPFDLTVADAMDVLADHDYLDGFDVVHTSPPCQAYAAQGGDGHPDLLPGVLHTLSRRQTPWVVENIPTAPITGLMLCGQSFGLHVRRHRIFASNVFLMGPGCACGRSEIRAYYGKPGTIAWKPAGWDNVQKKGRKPLYRGTVQQAPADMGIDWMCWDDLREAIPPAYTEHIGLQLIDVLAAA
jgi:DNA (cytosine-5)-methyltransferase 1